MDIAGLQKRLIASGNLKGPETGVFDQATTDAVIEFLTDGPDVSLSDYNLELAATELHAPLAHIRAVSEVEASGSPFVNGRPTILPEPHIFSRLTGHIYDASHPKISSLSWNRALYPKTQSDRYLQLVEMIKLNPLAGFGSASYGAFQILGCNYARCNVIDAMAFAWQEAQSVGDQLTHFIAFVKSDQILWRALCAGDWVTFAKRYNGAAYFKNRYDVRLAQAVRKFS